MVNLLLRLNCLYLGLEIINMKFSSVAYRLGYGKNIVGESNNKGITTIYYKTKDNLVRTKTFRKHNGNSFALKDGKEVFNATSVLKFSGGYILARQNREIKSECFVNQSENVEQES